MNYEETAKLMHKLSSLFPAFNPNEDAVRAWAEFLAKVPAPLAGAATDNLCSKGLEFPPNATQVAAEAKKLHAAANPDPNRPPPPEMWTGVIYTIRHCPPDRDKEFLKRWPEAARAVEAIGGFHALRTLSSEDIHRNLQPRFIRFYTEELARTETRKAAEPFKKLPPGDAPQIEGGSE